MRAAQLKKRSRHFANFTGLSVEQFEQLLEAAQAAAALQPREERSRQRAVGGGRKAKLALEEQLLVTLMYYRLYSTQILLGYLFSTVRQLGQGPCPYCLDDGNVSRVINRVLPWLLEVLPLPVQERLLFASDEPQGRRRIGTLEQLLKRHPEFAEVLIDAPEQETPKPKDRVKHKGNYSGKKKRHTLKTQVVTSCSGLLLHVSRAIAGKVNDLTLLRGKWGVT